MVILRVDAEQLEAQIRAVVEQRESEYDEEGDRWIGRPNPDEAYLLVDALVDAIGRTLRTFGVLALGDK